MWGLWCLSSWVISSWRTLSCFILVAMAGIKLGTIHKGRRSDCGYFWFCVCVGQGLAKGWPIPHLVAAFPSGAWVHSQGSLVEFVVDTFAPIQDLSKFFSFPIRIILPLLHVYSCIVWGLDNRHISSHS